MWSNSLKLLCLGFITMKPRGNITWSALTQSLVHKPKHLWIKIQPLKIGSSWFGNTGWKHYSFGKTIINLETRIILETSLITWKHCFSLGNMANDLGTSLSTGKDPVISMFPSLLRCFEAKSDVPRWIVTFPNWFLFPT